MDFSKAFDKLDFNILLNKLKVTGIDGKLGKWISFITNKDQQVLVNGSRSAPTRVLSGVPQGSVLGPLLFLILLGDIDKSIIHSFLSSFADDTQIGKGIRSLKDCRKLQDDLDFLYKWANENIMMFNGEKFEIIRYGKDKNLKASTHYSAGTGETIKEKPVVLKDLGVYMSNTADFAENVNQIILATTKLSSWILRTFESRDSNVMLTLWKSLVVPKVRLLLSTLQSYTEIGNGTEELPTKNNADKGYALLGYTQIIIDPVITKRKRALPNYIHMENIGKVGTEY